ncbi:MAG: hypothetical protein DDT42_02146 [candidate division WS2 bacterium]|uniref:Uncharacterized protein n=1 Tax=Psychracetigena formicireducens TaxID=2986056 RepID=A0A9E2F271_PSYF1|nr:hypothetical protein [Candidatus Psychracetigena formicireducens]
MGLAISERFSFFLISLASFRRSFSRISYMRLISLKIRNSIAKYVNEKAVINSNTLIVISAATFTCTLISIKMMVSKVIASPNKAATALLLKSNNLRKPGFTKRLLTHFKLVANPLYSSNITIPNFFAHLSYVNIYGASKDINIAPPNILQQIISSKYLVRILS